MAPVPTADRSEAAVANAENEPLMLASTPKSTEAMSSPALNSVQQAASCAFLRSLQPATTVDRASAANATAVNGFKRLFKFMWKDSFECPGRYPPPPCGSARSLHPTFYKSDGGSSVQQVCSRTKPQHH